MLYADYNELIIVIVIIMLFCLFLFLFVRFLILIMIIIGLIHKVVFFSMLEVICGLFILGLSFRIGD